MSQRDSDVLDLMVSLHKGILAENQRANDLENRFNYEVDKATVEAIDKYKKAYLRQTADLERAWNELRNPNPAGKDIFTQEEEPGAIVTDTVPIYDKYSNPDEGQLNPGERTMIHQVKDEELLPGV